MEPMNSWFAKPEFRRMIMNALLENDPYGAALDLGQFQALAVLSFCCLFVSGCVEMREQAAAGEPRRIYRLRHDVDISVLNPVDRVVAEQMQDYRQVYEIVPGAANLISMRTASAELSAKHRVFVVKDSGPAMRRKISEQFDQIMNDALRLNKPAEPTGCGV